ncbi:hypothetical protein H8K35_12120 [Undibacterium sp. LX40W]|uniref:Uncharacterized protein n=1 Tax=Undibacterium nitidum TaxID=2762298 RepID=A0A923HXP8_9BURK|nr:MULTISPECIES: hypothetical protein [Undibacterium]MBC3882131.1 hypothetical protein [Undibacterium nitidum]MBC3892412.1 hypothetical protein [Undibacterium sp. LX40W]
MFKKKMLRQLPKFGQPLVLMMVVLILVLVPRKIVSDHTRLIWRGELTRASLSDLVSLIEHHPNQYNVIQFRNSPGASASAGTIIDQVEQLIQNYHLGTEARGACASACASVFLLGENRTLFPGVRGEPTYLMLHATRQNTTREVDYGYTEKVHRKIAARSEGKFPLALLDRIFDDKKGTADGELYIFRDPRPSTLGPQHVFVCASAVYAILDTCEPVRGISPSDLGIDIAN